MLLFYERMAEWKKGLLQFADKPPSEVIGDESALQQVACKAETCKALARAPELQMDAKEMEEASTWLKKEPSLRLLKQHEALMQELTNKALEGGEWKLRRSMAMCEKLKTGKNGDWKQGLSGVRVHKHLGSRFWKSPQSLCFRFRFFLLCGGCCDLLQLHNLYVSVSGLFGVCVCVC